MSPIEPDFETLFASAPGFYLVLDRDLRIVAATEAYLQATLTRRADILGRYVFDVFPDNPGDSSADAVRNSTASFRRVLQSHVTDVMGLQRHDIRKPEAEGGGWEVRYWNAVNSPVLKPDGSLAYIMHRIENVTELVLLREQGVEQTDSKALRAHAAQMKAEIAERRRAEEALRESESRLRRLSDNLPEAATYLYVEDVNGEAHFEFISAGIERTAGLSAAEIVSNATLMARYIVPEDFSRLNAAIALSRERLTPFEEEVRHTHAVTGEMRCALLRSNPSRRQDGSTAWEGIQFDITERKRAEQAVRESEEQFRTLANAIPQLCWMANLDGWIFWYNQRWYQYTGTSPEQMEGWGWQSVHDPETLPRVLDRWKASIATGEPFDMVFPLRGADGVFRPFLTRVMPIRDRDGNVTRWFGTNTDISLQRRSEEALRESEEQFRALTENLHSAVALVDERGAFRIVNSSFLRIFDIPQDTDILNVNSYDWSQWQVFDERGLPLDVDEHPVRKAALTRTAVRNQLVAVKSPSNPDLKWLLVSAAPLLDAQGKLHRLICTYYDITDRKAAEDALRAGEEKYRNLFENIGEMVTVYKVERDSRGRIVERRLLEANRAFLRALGVASIEEARGRTSSEIFGTVWSDSHLPAVQTAMDTGQVQVQEVYRPESGRHYITSVVRLGTDTYLGTGTDITAIKRAEAALRESEERFRSVAENMSEGLMLFDAQGNFIYQNAASLGIHGFGTPGAGHVERENLPATWKGWDGKGRLLSFEEWPISRVLQGERFQDQILRATCVETGQEFYASYNGCPMVDANGRLIFGFITIREITELHKAEQELRESESRERARAAEVEALMQATPVAIFIAHDSECRSMTGNRAAHALLRMPAEKNLSKSAPGGEGPQNFRALKDGVEIPPPELPLQMAASSGKPVRNYPFDIVFDDGVQLNLVCDSEPLLDEKGRPRGGVCVLSDVTELKRAEQRLRESQKLESLGLLAGGVAHDFNNLLVGVVGNASLAREMLPPDHPVADLLTGVLKSGEQAAHLTRQMLAYSGKGKFVVEALDLSAVIPEMIGLVRPSISKKITLHLDLDEGLPSIGADRGQIQQVFMNLTLNAAEAIGSHEGLITVRTGVEEVDDRFKRLHPETAALTPGQYVFLEVRDTGCGMDEATRARIFDPFFSTKFVGRGLGLAAVDGIMRGHRGAIAVTSAPGQGTCFTVLLPPVATAAGKAIASACSTAIQGSGTVLVVDDEPIVLGMAKKALERRGYTVLVADSGAAAIDVARRHPGEIELVVLDLSMPQMSGEETLPELRKVRHDVKVVVSSGYSESEAMRLFNGQAVSGFIQKPYTSTGIAEIVKQCLG